MLVFKCLMWPEIDHDHIQRSISSSKRVVFTWIFGCLDSLKRRLQNHLNMDERMEVIVSFWDCPFVLKRFKVQLAEDRQQ